MLKDGCWNECHGQDYESEDKTKTRKHEQIFGFSGLRLGGDECWRRTHIRSKVSMGSKLVIPAMVAYSGKT